MRSLFILFVLTPQSFYRNNPNPKNLPSEAATVPIFMGFEGFFHEERESRLLKYVRLLASLKLCYMVLVDFYINLILFIFYQFGFNEFISNDG
ncbi:MAG: hypothetical protein LBB49_02935, partial [Gracilibacteraceae bacterium]|nr:hypothetical protein [Gracilibacteraceae bacterium]